MQPLVSKKIFIADRLEIPTNTQAVLWDMDGVLLDSLQLDFTVCNQLLTYYFSEQVKISKAFIRSLFAYDPLTFWQIILASVAETFAITDAEKFLPDILKDYEEERRNCAFSLNPGIAEILTALQARSLKMAVVSNNRTSTVKNILTRAGIEPYFDQIIGNDIQQVAKKPAPDTYLLATRLLSVNPEQCVVIEDSLLGLEAGYRARCYTIGVATGGTTFTDLVASALAQQVYQEFERHYCTLTFGSVRCKRLATPNEFVSHMLEHIAWRLGVAIDVGWYSNDWWSLGYFLGQKIKAFSVQTSTGVALGMIDDGSAEITVKLTETPTLIIRTVTNIDKDWFLALRCEQLTTGQPLIALLEGFSQGLGADITLTVCSVEDPHHSWESIFRALGIALNKMFAPQPPPPVLPFARQIEKVNGQGDVKVLGRSLYYSQVVRETAESYVKVAIDFSKQHPNQFDFSVSPSINVTQLPTLLNQLSMTLDCTFQIEFKATALSSSHVVLEDTALVLGRALLEILMLRMGQWGVNGAGSSVCAETDFFQPVRVGISVEGRKFLKFVPFNVPMESLRKNFIIGHTVCGTLRSEDLDDFLDGLVGGLVASIIIHVATPVEADIGWQQLFQQLGKALKEAFQLNPYRRGVPPGVKATLS